MKRRFSPWAAAVAMMLAAANNGAFAQNNNPAPPAPPVNAAPAPAANPPAPAPDNGPPPPPVQDTPQPPRGGPMQHPDAQPHPLQVPMSPPAPKPKPLVAPPGVAATVNGQKITTAQVAALALKVAGPNLVDQFINNMLLDQEAKKKNVSATPADIAAHVAEARQQVAQRYPGQTLEELLARGHHTYAEFLENVRYQVLAEKLAGGGVAPTVPSVHVRHILILTNNPTGAPDIKPHTEAEAQAIIVKIQDALKAGQKFEDLAKQYSEDPSNKDKGGDLGVINAQTQFDPTFLAAAMTLKKGDVTPTAIKSMYGLHLIKADSTSADPTPADKPLYVAAAKQADQQRLAQAVPAYIQSLRANAKIVNYLAQ